MTTMTVQIPTGQVGWFEQMLRSMGWALCTFAPTYKKNLTPKFVFRTGTPGDYAAKVGKYCFGLLLELISNSCIYSLIIDIYGRMIWSKANKTSFILQTENKTMIFKIQTYVNTSVKTFCI